MLFLSKCAIFFRLAFDAGHKNLIALFSDDSKQAQIDALEATISRLEHEKVVICEHLHKLRYELMEIRNDKRRK